MNIKITKNFTLDELVKSSTADSKGINNTPTLDQVENLMTLTRELLQPVRDRLGKPMNVNSGFRTSELNSVVGGSRTSDHMAGRAADIRTDNPRELFNLVRESGLSFDQLILYPTFVHMSYRSEKENRNQVLYAKGVTP